MKSETILKAYTMEPVPRACPKCSQWWEMYHSTDASYVPRGEDEEGTQLLLSPLVTTQFPASEEWMFCSLAALLENKSKPCKNYTKALLHTSFEDI